MPASPAVLLMAGAPGAGGARPELRELLGAERCAALEETLTRRAVDWAAAIAPGPVHFAYTPEDGESGLRALSLRDEVALFAQRRDASISERLGDAVQRVVAAGSGGPVLVMWPELARWRPEHAEGALDDLSDGCVASVGPVFDGGFYLLALARPVPSLFRLPADTWDSPDAMGLVLGAINEAGLPVGLLRAERGLRRRNDVRAALADPLLDDELRAILGGSAAGGAGGVQQL